MAQNDSDETPPTRPFAEYMTLSLVALFCCLPFGIAAIIYTCKTKKANKRGDEHKAERYSNLAFSLGLTAVILGLWIYIVRLSFFFLL